MAADGPPAIKELQAWPHWVVWKIEERDGKQTKVPYQAARPSTRASSTDPSTWGTYEQAAEAVRRGRAEGVGYVFAPDDEYCGVDFDKCVTPADGVFAQAVGPVIDGAATEMVARLASYTELSPSGTGLHTIVRGRINGKRNRTGKTPWGGEFEFYDQSRFFTITGEHLAGTPDTIESRQDVLDALAAELFPTPPAQTNGIARPRVPVPDTDVDLLERIRKSKQGPAFERLWRGEHDGDDSAADLALCNILAFWTGGDETRMDALFRQSGLLRDKWDEQRGERTYGDMTIEKALEGRTEFFGSTPRMAPSKKFEGREEAVAEARRRAAELLGIQDRKVVGGRSWGQDLDARVEVDITNTERPLVLERLGAYTAPAKLNALISFQVGGEPALTQALVNELFRCLRLICSFQEAVTLERRARDCGASFLQEAQTILAEMVNDQAQRWAAMAQLADRDPVSLSKSSDKSIAGESIVIVDGQGTRYVRASWFAAYARAYAMGATAEQILGRMVSLGWAQPGTEGRIKATQPGTKKTLNWAFFTVPKGWEEQ